MAPGRASRRCRSRHAATAPGTTRIPSARPKTNAPARTTKASSRSRRTNFPRRVGERQGGRKPMQRRPLGTRRIVSQSEWEDASQLAKASQREVLCDVMLTAERCGAWLTLRELARMTRYGEASISAQLRHLRKPQYGSFVLEKRLREG